MIDLEQAARAAIDAIRAAAIAAGFVVAIAITDDHGDLVAAQRMEGCRPRWMRASLRKAHTAAVMDRDTQDFHAEIVRRQIDIAYYGDELFTALPGGIVVQVEGRTVAGIGVTGPTQGRDIELARHGLAAFGAALGNQKP
ncbi:MAG TPA: heme-binding protein [Candidatus Binataceae bacterium]|nr:heme-binding protein [Candidatus Binataceae bacterium]